MNVHLLKPVCFGVKDKEWGGNCGRKVTEKINKISKDKRIKRRGEVC
jgi:hypothetical protein